LQDQKGQEPYGKTTGKSTKYMLEGINSRGQRWITAIQVRKVRPRERLNADQREAAGGRRGSGGLLLASEQTPLGLLAVVRIGVPVRRTAAAPRGHPRQWRVKMEAGKTSTKIQSNNTHAWRKMTRALFSAYCRGKNEMEETPQRHQEASRQYPSSGRRPNLKKTSAWNL